jgi:hypothetical protein
MNIGKFGGTLALCAGLAAGGLAAVPSPAAGAPAVAHPAGAHPVADGVPSSGTVTLVTGDRVAVTSSRPGWQADAVARAAGSAGGGAVIRLSLGGQSYVVPAYALPYVGRGLSPALFAPASLLRAESGGELLVEIGYRGRLRALPGITITGSRNGTARGYLTAASAPAFGAALARQFAADHASGSYGADGMFAGGVSIGLPGQAPAAPARPDYPMRTLTVTGTDLAGRPDTGDTVMVLNVDSTEKFGDFNEIFNVFYHGTAKFSVPTGHYMAIVIFTSMAGTRATGYRLVTLPQFTVAEDTTVAIDERTATDRVQMVTPRPAVTQDLTLDIHRVMADSTASNGDTFDQSVDAGTVPLWSSPAARPVTVGELRTITTGYLTSPGGVSPAYDYDLAFAGPNGVIGPQRWVASPAGLATVHASFYQDVRSTGGWMPVALFRFQITPITAFFVSTYPFRLPRSLTQYFSAGRALFWEDGYYQSLANLTGGQAGTWRTFSPGQVTTEQWNAYPLHPAPSVSLPGNPFLILPSASRAGNTLTLAIAPFGDNTPGHTGTGFTNPGPNGCQCTITGSYQLNQNGKKIASGNAATGGTDVFLQAGISGRPSTIAFTLTAARAGRQYPLSAASQTTWTWRSRREPRARVPLPWTCASLTQSCAVQPLLTLRYQVRGLALDGSVRPGRQQVEVTVGHLQLAAAARITGLTAQMSVNDGKTWKNATVTAAGAGHFEVAFTAPPGALLSLRVHAADAAGGQITETITRGYRTAVAGPAAAGAGRFLMPPPIRGDGPMRAACPSPRPGHARCYALFAPQSAVNAAIAAGVRGRAAAPAGWGATDIEAAYRLPVTRNPRQTVALVDAFSTPGLAANLAVYRHQYGLPACTTASGCLRIVNQNGKAGPLPSSGVPYGWDVETMLDVSMVSAACPHCKILVVEARDDSMANLAAAENTAARLGAQVISNSYGARESGFSQIYAPAYDHRGHVIVVATGDDGFTAANFPANLATVTAVGGTQLARARNARGWAEQVWDDYPYAAGSSGCSAYVAKPAWQHDPHCGMRTVADVSALAWNVAIYEKIQGGWMTVGGTSASAPLIAGVYGLAGNAPVIRPGDEYRHTRSLFDITTGTNDLGYQGGACGYDYLCTAKKGYDAPTGLGTPDGTGAF